MLTPSNVARERETTPPEAPAARTPLTTPSAPKGPILPIEKSQLCFWLQGHFEVADQGAPLTADQVAVIDAKLARAEAHPMPAAGKPAAFCVWLRGQLDAHALIAGAGAAMSPAQTEAIKARLDDVFTHVAPPPPPRRPESDEDFMNRKYAC